MSHKPEEIIEALMEEMNGIIEDELLMAALKLEPPASRLNKADLKLHAKQNTRPHEGKLVVDYIWRERVVITVMEPSVHPSGRAMVFAVKRHLEEGKVVTPKLIYRPPAPAPVVEDHAAALADIAAVLNPQPIPERGRKVFVPDDDEVHDARALH